MYKGGFPEWKEKGYPIADGPGTGPHDHAPTPISGKNIWNFLEYPRLALEMKLEGKVFIKFFIDKHGKVGESSIQMLKGNPVFEEAAVNAVAQSQWNPAMQREMKVGVWVTVPVKFNLND